MRKDLIEVTPDLKILIEAFLGRPLWIEDIQTNGVIKEASIINHLTQLIEERKRRGDAK